MRRCLRNFILGFLLLWLPLQGYAATGMSFCRHDHASPSSLQAGTQGHQESHDCGNKQNHPSAVPQTQCDNCGYCDLSGAPALLPTLVDMGDDAGFPFKFAFDTHFPLFFPQQPQRPPHAHFS